MDWEALLLDVFYWGFYFFIIPYQIYNLRIFYSLSVGHLFTLFIVSFIRSKTERPFLPSPAQHRLTLRPPGSGAAVQPHDHGGEGHLALHTVLPDGIDDSSWEVDVEVTEEDDAVRVLGTEVGGSAAPTDHGEEARPLSRAILRLFPISMTDKLA